MGRDGIVLDGVGEARPGPRLVTGADVAKAEKTLKVDQARRAASEAYLRQAHIDWWLRQAECFRQQARLLAHASVPLGSPVALVHELKALTFALFQSAAEYDVPIEQVHEQGAKIYAEKKRALEEAAKKQAEVEEAIQKPAEVQKAVQAAADASSDDTQKKNGGAQ